MKEEKKADHDPDLLKERAQRLGLFGLLAHFDEFCREPWLPKLLQYEQAERDRRSLVRRIKSAKLGRFKPMSDFEWKWPKKIDQGMVSELFELEFIKEAANVILVGPNGVGKTMIAKNLAHQAVLRGATARFLTASEMLNDLAAQDGGRALQCRLRHYCRPQLLVLDELGYLSYDNRHADLLFEIVSRRYALKSILITTNKAFVDWNDVFPNAACVVSLVDRLLHHAEIVEIDGESYRLKEAQENAARRSSERAARRKRTVNPS